MPENPAQSYVLSATLHAAVVVLCVFLAYVAESPPIPDQKIIELVAGEGNNYSATAAPAPGLPDGDQIKIPAAPIAPPTPPAPTPTPVPVEAAPITPAPVPARVPVKAVPVKAVPTPVPAKPKPPAAMPDFSKTVTRVANRTEQRIEARKKKQAEALAKRLALEAQKQQISYDQYLKEHGQGIAAGVVGGSTANKTGGAGGKALSREAADAMQEYFALLQARLKESYVAPPDVTDNSLTADVKFFVSANGSISNVEIVRSSGNAAFDESLREAFRQMRAGVGPRPDHRAESVSFPFSMKENDAN